MLEFFVNLLLYVPPLACGVAYYFKERKRQAKAPKPNPILLYLVPLVIFAGGMTLWSYALYTLLSLLG